MMCDSLASLVLLAIIMIYYIHVHTCNMCIVIIYACTHKFTVQSPLQGDESSSLLPETSSIRYSSSHVQFTFHYWTIKLLSSKHVYTIHFHLRSEQVAVCSEISNQFYSVSGGNATFVQRSTPPNRPICSQMPTSLPQSELVRAASRKCIQGGTHQLFKI